MPFLRRLPPLLLVAALVGSVAVLPALASDGAGAAASKGNAKGKKCPKGKKAVTVTKNGKKVRKCVKKGKKPPLPCRATASCAIPGPPSLFEPPGKQLTGNDAKPFLEKYLLNSTFTDCVPGWPNCSVEQRYSHAADNTFRYCRLTSTSGADINSVGEYGVDNARIEPDGSWIFHEIVGAYGNQSEYEWQVSTTGVVTGAYRFQPSSEIEKIGPLQYVGGVAKDCSY